MKKKHASFTSCLLNILLFVLSSSLSLPQLFPTVSCIQPTTDLLIFVYSPFQPHLSLSGGSSSQFSWCKELCFPFEGRCIVCLSFITWYHSSCLDFGRHLLEGAQRQFGRISGVLWDELAFLSAHPLLDLLPCSDFSVSFLELGLVPCTILML